MSHATVELALPAVSNEEFEAARAVVADRRAEKEPVPKFVDRMRAFTALDVRERLGKPLSVAVRVLALGRAPAWVSLPGEIFVELGLQIKNGSPFKQTSVAELANGSIGYVPNRVAHAQGIYEVQSARCAGGGEQLVDRATAQSRALSKVKE